MCRDKGRCKTKTTLYKQAAVQKLGGCPLMKQNFSCTAVLSENQGTYFGPFLLLMRTPTLKAQVFGSLNIAISCVTQIT
jgi:hypothetical protein